MPRQPQVDVSPVQVNATHQELELFHFFRAKVVPHLADECNRPLWNLHFLQAAQHQPSIWHACTALAALRMREQFKPFALDSTYATDRRKSFYITALQQHGRALQTIIAMIQPYEPLSHSDKGTILATTILFGFCSLTHRALSDAVVHLAKGLNLLHEWKIWQSPPGSNVTPSSRVNGSLFPSTALLLFYVQQEVLSQYTSISESRWTWEWEDALSFRQKEPFTCLSDACLELEMVWIGARGLLNGMPLTPSLSQARHVSQGRQTLYVYLQNWKARLRDFQDSSRYLNTSDGTFVRILDFRTIFVDILLRVDIAELPTSWDVLEPEFQRAIGLIESLLGQGKQHMTHRGVHNPEEVEYFSFTPTLSNSLHFAATTCRQPRLRRRAIDLLREQRRREGGGTEKGPSFYAKSAQAIVEVEESAWLSPGVRHNNSTCGCLVGSFICNMHRVVDFRVTYATIETGELLFRTVGDILHNRPARTILLSSAFPCSLDS